MPELVADGVSGCIVGSEDEAVAAIARASALDRFTVERGAVARRGAVHGGAHGGDGYEALYSSYSMSGE